MEWNKIAEKGQPPATDHYWLAYRIPGVDYVFTGEAFYDGGIWKIHGELVKRPLAWIALVKYPEYYDDK